MSVDIGKLTESLVIAAGETLGRGISRTDRLDASELQLVTDTWMTLLKQQLQIPIHRREIEDHPDADRLAQYSIRQAGELRHQLARSPLETASQPLYGRLALILSAPRSGSTLLRVMLAGHPDLFCPPELHLLGFADMAKRRHAESGTDRNNGLAHAVSHLHCISRAQAEGVVEAWETEGRPMRSVYGELVAAADPKIFIDKSPGNTRSLDRIEQSLCWFPNIKLIHLVRHPKAVIHSLVRNRFSHLMGGGGLDPYEFGERLWLQYNATAAEACRLVASDNSLRVQYEDLVTQPHEVLRQVCEMLGVPFSRTVLTPYEGDRMRLGAGDLNFLDHSTIEPERAKHYQDAGLPYPLNPMTKELASRLGYDDGPT